MTIKILCIWFEDDDGTWATSCGQKHEFMCDGPEENHYKYCPYCGKNIETVDFEEGEGLGQ